MRLKNKIAVITGASQGIGKQTAQTFLREGATVINLDIGDAKWQQENLSFKSADVTDRERLRTVVDEIAETFGRIDILVNNAGVTKDALLHKMTEEMWDRVIDVNLKGTFNVTQLIGPMMMAQGSGSIVNISSIVGEDGNIGQTNYAATKAGVIAMAKTWAKEFSRKGAAVRVNVVAPGFANTDLMKTIPYKVLNPIREKTMLGRLAEPQEIANGVLFLASDEASFITGQVLSINGGLRF
ncbi:3-oxoacyl-ACP reductase FabG [Psychrobacter sp. H8-1]|uniref:3-oxoacyl-ACP reductase FabG n=1 Tax=Psychrobacter sp. H8-1 TaxID=2774129 RepID=UPI0019190A57|nr:3-oxoacyl-ACP reductase FabG [Psychrobacter sp. H8-1]